MEHLGTRYIETEHLILRRFTIEDSCAMYENWASDPEVTRYLTWPAHRSPEISETVLHDWISRYEEADYYQWAIVLKETGDVPIGSIAVVSHDDHVRKAHIGYCIGRAWWHKGIMTEALGAVMDFLFDEVGVRRIDSRHDPRNPHSGAVMRKCGMRFEGTLRQSDRNNQGICDASWYALLAEDRWADSKCSLAAEKWGLSGLETVYRHREKAVFTGESDRYGAVILKIDGNPAQLGSEHDALARMQGPDCCRLWAYDQENGLLLEERILPGTSLREEAELEARIRTFSQVFHSIHAPAPLGETYMDWLENAYRYCSEHQVAEKLTRMAARAREICTQIFARYPDRVLLHGDLHHDNLLRRADGSYAVIDPKGVVGPAVLDLPRFIINEVDTIHEGSDEAHVDRATRLVAQATGYALEDVRKLCFMEAVLANIWCLEDGEAVNDRELELAAAALE